MLEDIIVEGQQNEAIFEVVFPRDNHNLAANVYCSSLEVSCVDICLLYLHKKGRNKCHQSISC